MKTPALLLIFCIFGFILMPSIMAQFSKAKIDGRGASNRVHLSDIKSLTFRRGDQTTYRRTRPYPVLQCNGGSASGEADSLVHTVQCYNKGSDGQTIQWKCESELPDSVQFGRVQVVCEGYDKPGDSYVLAGSCQLEFELDYTRSSSYHNHHNNNGGGGGGRTSSYYEDTESTGTGYFFFVLLCLVAFIWLLNKCCLSDTTGTTRSTTYYPSGPGSNMYPDDCRPTAPSYTTASDSGPGFWSGAAMGAAVGAAVGRATAPRNNTSYRMSSPSSSYAHSSSASDGSSGETKRRTATAYGETATR